MNENTMTLEQVRNLLFAMSHGEIGDEPHEHGVFRRMADAIDAHVAAQSAMRVDETMVERAMLAWSGYWCDCNDANACGDNRDAMRAALEADRAGRGVDVPDEMDAFATQPEGLNYADGWNACREAMIAKTQPGAEGNGNG